LHVVTHSLPITIDSLLRTRGFTLVEVLVATTVLVVGVATLASLSTMATHANMAARTTTRVSLLATQKMEQLRALTWGYDALGRPTSDTTTDLTVFPPATGNGVGLSTAPAGALSRNTAGYCDFLDAAGTPLGGGTTAPVQSEFVRRWSVDPLPSNPANALVLQVLVLRAHRPAAASARPLPDEAAYVTVMTRKGT
jgi:prepilin-type N-terminal cleavage/methylation domain-containing protein